MIKIKDEIEKFVYTRDTFDDVSVMLTKNLKIEIEKLNEAYSITASYVVFNNDKLVFNFVGNSNIVLTKYLTNKKFFINEILFAINMLKTEIKEINEYMEGLDVNE